MRAINLFTLMAKIGLDDKDFNSGINSATNSGKGFASSLSSATVTGVKSIAKGMAVAVGLASTAMVALGKIGMDYNSEMESYTTNFEVMLGSQEKALKKVDELKKFAAATPFEMADLAKGTQTLLAFGVASEDSTEILKQLGDIALGDSDKFNRLTNAFGKANSSGKLTGETLQQMIDAGFNPLNVISQKTGESMDELSKRMSAGGISAEELEDAMKTATTTGGQFADGMAKAALTTKGLMSTLKDNVRSLVGEVFVPLSNSLLQNVLPGAISAIDELTTAFRERGVQGMIDAAGQMFGSLLGIFFERTPEMVEQGFNVVSSFLQGIQDNLPMIATGAVNLMSTFVLKVMEQMPQIAQMTFDLIIGIAKGLADNAPNIITGVVALVKKIVELISDPENLKTLYQAGKEIVIGIGQGIKQNLPELIDIVKQIPIFVLNLIKAQANMFIDIGKAIIDGIWQGIVSGFGKLGKNIENLGDDMANALKKKLGIHSPSRVFKWIGQMTAEGFGVGFDDKITKVKKNMDSEFDFTNFSTGKFGKSSTFGGTVVNQYIEAVPMSAYELSIESKAAFERLRWA